MPHVRQQIRVAAAAALAGLPTTGARVFTSRVYTLRDADLPCLLVSTEDEDISSLSASTSILERSLLLRIRALGKANATLDNTLDQVLAELEPVLSGNTLGGLVKDIALQSVRVQMDDSLDKPAGVLEATYLVTYYTAGANPNTPI